MKPETKVYVAGIIVGLVLISTIMGASFSLYKQRNTIKELIRSRAPNLFSISWSRNGIANKEEQPIGDIEISVDPLKELVAVNRMLYGANLDPQMENNQEIVGFVKNIGISCFRFGKGSAGYHWKTGKSDFNTRADNSPLSNVANVIDFCKRANTQLIIQVNVESGTPLEAAEWVKYMKEKEFPVKYWQLGDEVFGDWDKGYIRPEKYAEVIKEYSTAMKAVDPTIKVGMDWAPTQDEDFNIKVVKRAGDYIDFIAYHWYPNHINPGHKFKGRIHPTPKEVMANYLQVPVFTSRAREIFKKYAPHRKDAVEITIMAWDGAWDGPNSDFPPYSQGIAQWSLCNALFHADALGQFAKSGVTVAAQYLLQDINFGLIRGWDKEAGWGGQPWDGKTIRPKAFAIKLFAQHFGDILISSEVKNSPTYFKEHDWWPDSYTGNVPYISCYASKFSNKKTVALVIINKHEEKAYRVNISLENISPKKDGRIYILSGPSLISENEAETKNVRIKEFKAENVAKSFKYNVPARSVNVVEIYY